MARRLSRNVAGLSVFGRMAVDSNLHMVWLALRAGGLTIESLQDRDEASAAQVVSDEAAMRAWIGRNSSVIAPKAAL